MSWKSGSEIMENIARSLEARAFHEQPPTGDPVRVVLLADVYGILIHEFEQADCDTLYELVGNVSKEFDSKYEAANPNEDE
jgi:hypothetical protein